MTEFRGFPDEALRFYEGLEADNSKAYWSDHKPAYDEIVRAPFDALLREVEPEFGAGRMFRPYRDTRFSKDKSPYKTQAAAAVGERQDAVYYVQLSAEGLYVGAGLHAASSGQVARLRAAVDDDATGTELADVVATLEASSYEIGGEELKTVPRGYDRDHPRARLLRHKGVYGGRAFAPARWLHSLSALDRIVTAWRNLAPLNAWLATHVGPPDG